MTQTDLKKTENNLEDIIQNLEWLKENGVSTPNEKEEIDRLKSIFEALSLDLKKQS